MPWAQNRCLSLLRRIRDAGSLPPPWSEPTAVSNWTKPAFVVETLATYTAITDDDASSHDGLLPIKASCGARIIFNASCSSHTKKYRESPKKVSFLFFSQSNMIHISNIICESGILDTDAYVTEQHMKQFCKFFNWLEETVNFCYDLVVVVFFCTTVDTNQTQATKF